MKDDSKDGRPAPWMDPATEARVVALVLGEVSDFEEAELNRLVAKWPELRLLKNRLEAVNALLAEAEGPAGKGEWKLGEGVREKLLDAMDSVSAWGLRRDKSVSAWGLRRDKAASSSESPRSASGPLPETDHDVRERSTVAVETRPKEWRVGQQEEDSAGIPEMPVIKVEREWGRRRPRRRTQIRWKRVVAACVVVGLITVAVYSPTLFQDDSYEAEKYSRLDLSSADSVPQPVDAPAFQDRNYEQDSKEVQSNLAALGATLTESYQFADDRENPASSVREFDRNREPLGEVAAEPGDDPFAVVLQPGDVVDVPQKNWLGNGGGGAEVVAKAKQDEAGRGREQLSAADDLPWPGQTTLGWGEVGNGPGTGLDGARLTRRGLEESATEGPGLGDQQGGAAGAFAKLREERGEMAKLRAAGLGERHPGMAKGKAVVAAAEADLAESAEVAQEVLQTQLDLIDGRLQKMKEVVGVRRDDAVDKALASQDYLEAKEEYESAKAMLQTMKITQSSKRVALKIPKSPITIHEEATTPVKKGGTIFGGGSYESQAVVQANPAILEVDPLAGSLETSFTGAYPTRNYMKREHSLVTSERTLSKVVDELDLARKWGTSKREALEDLKQAVSADQVRGTDLLGIKVRVKDARDAEAIAGTVAKVYQEQRAGEKRERAERAVAAMEAEVRAQEDMVEEKRKLFHTIVKSVGIPYIEGVSGSGQMGRSEEQILQVGQREEYEMEKERQQLEIQLKTLMRLKGEELGDYLAGLKLRGTDPVLLERAGGEAASKSQALWLGVDEKDAAVEPHSTFSLHVSDVSFKLAKAALDRGEWPAREKIRTEEFINAFDYGGSPPSMTERVGGRVEQAAHPFMQERNLLRISVRTAAEGRSEGTPLRLTVLLDNSGSMERMDRAESVQRAFQLLAAQMTSGDLITLIGFARTPRLLADRMPGDQAGELGELIARTQPEGGTNLEEALRLGMAKAQEQWLEGAQNRIVVLTDGAANLGNADPGLLARMVEEMRDRRIAFDACGVGADGLNDQILESLTRQGDGRYYFLDRPEDADEGFARQIAGALRPAAENVKVQVRFNPERVGRYKLFGFEKHRLAKEDFRDDAVDAAELAAEEAGTALYQVEALPQGEGPIGTVSVRFRDTASRQMVERRWTIPYKANAPRLEEAGAGIRLAACAAFLGEKLGGSTVGDGVEMKRLAKVANGLPSLVRERGRVRDLLEMVEVVRGMGD